MTEIIQNIIKEFKKFDKLNLNKKIPLFNVPIHGTFDGIKLIPEFDIEYLKKTDVISAVPNASSKENNFIFLKHFGKCFVLNGLKDCKTEFNILCGIQTFNKHITWIYLTNEEYGNLLVDSWKANIENLKSFYEPFSVGKVYKLNNTGGGLFQIYEEFDQSIKRYENDDLHGVRSLIGINNLKNYPRLNENDEFMVVKIKSLYDDMNSLEQENESIPYKNRIIAEKAYQIIGIGKDFFGYISDWNMNSFNYFEEIG